MSSVIQCTEAIPPHKIIQLLQRLPEAKHAAIITQARSLVNSLAAMGKKGLLTYSKLEA